MQSAVGPDEQKWKKHKYPPLSGAGISLLLFLSTLAPGVPSLGLCNSHQWDPRFSGPALILSYIIHLPGTGTFRLKLSHKTAYLISNLWTAFHGANWSP